VGKHTLRDSFLSAPWVKNLDWCFQPLARCELERDYPMLSALSSGTTVKASALVSRGANWRAFLWRALGAALKT
jgi:hypothetical protein